MAADTSGGWVNVDLLLVDRSAVAAARECVEDRQGAEAVSCYAFSSRDAYAAAAPSGAGNFNLTCWAARWTRNKAGSTSGGTNDFVPPECPTDPVSGSSDTEEGSTLPEYRILDTVDQLSGGRYGDVLVPSLSQDTASARLEEVAREIASAEGFDELALYCSEAAMQAQFSRSFAEANPDAEACYLGSLRDGAFDPPPAVR